MRLNSPLQLKILIPFFVLFICLAGFSADDPLQMKSMAAKLTATDPLNVVSNYLRGELMTPGEPVTIKVMALRAQFVKDSLKTTTGDGYFDLSNQSDYIVDRPPHNKTYFEQQLLALRNYFYFVSKGKLILEYEVYPPAEDQAYQMPNNMVYYSGEENEKKQKQRWAELLHDAVEAAKTDNPDFANYDAFIVFHAGVGNDFAFDFNETPFDIQSAFIDFETLRETLGQDNPNYPGIDAGQNFYIQEGIILPEQQCQKEINLGLLGTATLLMGSQLGMPSLFDTKTGRAGIGMWGLMDQGSYNFYGLIPAQPCAWMKLYMGWENAVTVTTIDEAFLGTSHTKSAPHLIKVPITSSEYFLLENRQEDWNGDNMTFGRDEYGKRAQFDSLGNIAVEEGLRVITRVDEYDFGLPGSGILIWHIDEEVIRENLASNTINDNPGHRGVDLVECDGPQDIGQQYAMFTPGYGTEAGDYWDPFWSGNISHKYINGERPVSLSPTSIPNSNAYGRAVTHLTFSNFSDNDTLMSFNLGNDWSQPGFPQYTGQLFGEGALNHLRFADDQEGVFAVALNGDIFGWKKDGTKIINNDVSITVEDGLGNVNTYSVALMGSVGDSVFLAPAVQDVDNDQNDDIIVVDKSGSMTIWSSIDGNGDGSADLLQRIDLGERITTIPTDVRAVGTELGNYVTLRFTDNGSLEILQKYKVASEPILAHLSRNWEIFLTKSGQVLCYDFDGETLRLCWQTRAYGWGEKFFIVSGNYNINDGETGEPFVVVSNDGYITLIDFDGHVLNSETRIAETRLVSAPALGDMDGDGQPELLIATENGISAYEISSAVAELNYPVLFTNPARAGYLAAPIFFQSEWNGKPWPHAIAATSTGSVLSYGSDGKIVDGFPLATGSPVFCSPLILPVDQTGEGLLLFVLAEDGFLYGWNMNRTHATLLDWPRFGNTNNNSFESLILTPPSPQLTDLMPKNRVFCYPNPSEAGRTIIRYTLNGEVTSVNIRIYDIAGELVTQFNDGGAFAGDHEVVWDVSTIQSGAYIARVEAEANSGNVVEFIKIAVVK